MLTDTDPRDLNDPTGIPRPQNDAEKAIHSLADTDFRDSNDPTRKLQPHSEADKAIQFLAEAGLGDLLNDVSSKTQINAALDLIREHLNTKINVTKETQKAAKPDKVLDSKLYALGSFVRAHDMYEKIETKYYDIVVIKARVNELVDLSKGWIQEKFTASYGELRPLYQCFYYGHANVP